MNRHRLLVQLFAALLSLFLVAVWSNQPTFGQADTGSISGVVRDPSGGVLPNAMVAVTNAATGATRTVQTDVAGAYTASSLAPGVYKLQITAGGFQPFTGQAEVTVGGHVTMDAQLSVSKQTET